MRQRQRQKLRWPIAYSLLMTVLSSAVVLTYLLAPGMWQWRRAEVRADRHKIFQIDTAADVMDSNMVFDLREAASSDQGAPVILTYHDVGYNRSKYTVTPQAFATQMQTLHDAGWTTLTAGQLDGWLDGTPVPAHSVMITFDDGCQGVWQFAEPVLARLGMHASAFIITGFVGTHEPYYMTWDEIMGLYHSGHWDIEAHTHLGHVQVPTDPVGGHGWFLTNRMWLPMQNRLETVEEWHSRVWTDLAECKHQFALHNLPAPHFFAFPFSAHEGDPELTGQLSKMVGALYRIGMLDDADDIATTSSNDTLQGLVERMDVTANLDQQGFIRKILQAVPLDPQHAQPGLDRLGWVDEQSRPAAVDADRDGKIQINPDAGEEVMRDYAPVHAVMWHRYTVSVDVAGLAPLGANLAGISVLKPPSNHPGPANQLPRQVDVTIHGDSYSIDVRGVIQPVTVPLPDAPAHHVVVVVAPERVTVTVDNYPPHVLDLPPTAPRTLGGGISLYAVRDAPTSPPLEFSNVTMS